MTQEEVYNIIATEIIDNTTRLIDPARLRGVLNAIVALVPSSSDPASLVATTPLALDEFTSTLSISQASESTPGYLGNLDFKKFSQGSEAIPASDFRLAFKGYQGGVANTGEWPTIELNDACWSFRSTSDIPDAGEVGLFQYVDAEKDDQDPTAYIPLLTTAVNVT